MRAREIGLALLGVGLASGAAFAFENAQVLPKGVRNVNLRTVRTDISHKSDGDGTAVPLAQPLNQQLTFKKIAAGEEKLKATQLKAFLLSNGFDENQSVGEFHADLKGHLDVTAPIFAYGLTDRVTVAVAAPYYRGQTSIEVGFTPNQTAQAFLDSLARTEVNQTHAAREAGLKLNNAVANLNDKLIDNGYRPLEDWEAAALGDLTMVTKVQILKSERLVAATAGGVVVPTGRTDDPDILNDIAFGDGQWDVFGQVVFDEPLPSGLTLTQHGKYTVQLPDDKVVRAETEDEKIEVGKERARFKLGDKIDAGTSLTWAPTFGLVSGIGYAYFRKYGDTYRELNGETKALLEDGTDQEAHNGEAVLGYSTVPLYQRGSFAVPFEMKLTYTRQFASRNMPITDLAQFDLSLFF